MRKLSRQGGDSKSRRSVQDAGVGVVYLVTSYNIALAILTLPVLLIHFTALKIQGLAKKLVPGCEKVPASHSRPCQAVA